MAKVVSYSASTFGRNVELHCVVESGCVVEKYSSMDFNNAREIAYAQARKINDRQKRLGVRG